MSARCDPVRATRGHEATPSDDHPRARVPRRRLSHEGRKMKRVTRSEILDYVTYEEKRAELRKRAMAEKDARRVDSGGVLTFLFENAVTIRYQIHEMMRTERIVKEAEIQHEIDTYN